MKSRTFLVFALLTIAALLFGGCATAAPTGGAAPAAEQAGEEAAPAAAGTGAVLDVVFGTEPPTMDPSLATDSQSIWSIRQMFMGLTGFNEAAEVVPSLATEWTASEDGLTWTYTMRDDVHWVKLNPDTGEFEDLGPVTAQDVVYGVRRTLDPRTTSSYAYLLWILAGAEEFNTADPATADLDALAKWAQKQGLRVIPVGVFEDTNGLPAYKLAADADVTVLLFVDRKVVANFAFRAGELTDAKVAEVAKALVKFKANPER